MDWVLEELSTLSLGDKRLERRAGTVLKQLSQNAADSIPVACRGAAEIKAAYRFFDNEHVTPEKIQETHLEATLERLSRESVVLIAQDTTVLNFTGQIERKDTGPTTRDATKGMYLHCSLALTPEKVCLGMISSKQWHRDTLQKLTRKEKNAKNYAIPLEEKESYRWLEHYRLANTCALKFPSTTIVSIADREADIYDIYEEAATAFSDNSAQAHYIIRAKTDRKVCTEEGQLNGEQIKSSLKKEGFLGEITLHVSKTENRKARDIHLNIYAKTLYIALPDKRKKNKDSKPVQVTAILCTENQPPSQDDRIEWLLLTDLPVHSFEQACEKIQWYTCRWQIEIFFKILKSGCTIEKLQLTDKNFSVCLSFYMIIAWRILYVVILGRQSPDCPCDIIFSQEEWQTVYVVANKQKPPALPPTINEMIRMIASLGGYLNRRSDPEPGVKTLWIGMRNLQEHLRAKEAFEAVYGIICG